MSMVGAAAATQDVEAREMVHQPSVLQTELYRIALIQFRGLVQLRVALARGVGTEAPNPAQPGSAIGKNVLEMCRVRAVDHIE